MLTNDYSVIVTDTLAKPAFGPDFHTAKVVPIPHMRIAVATRGRMNALGTVAGLLMAGACNYETARAFLATGYRDLRLGDVEIVVAGWSEKGPAAFIISSTNSDGKVIDIGHVMVTPTVPGDLAQAFASDPVGGMPGLLRAQTRSGVVGGQMVVTQVGEHTIESYCAGIIDVSETR